MFVQVIEGKVGDREGIRRQMDRWLAEIKPGAKGFLGSTGGVTADGRGILLARFESAEAAKANSGRPEQGSWWADTEACFDGPVSFADSTEVDTFLAGGSDAAGFVQIMKGTGDPARLRAMDELMTKHSAEWRPDVIGGIRVWTGPSTYVEAIYFTSEAEARAGEQMPPPDGMAAAFAEVEEQMANVEFLDLTNPIITPA